MMKKQPTYFELCDMIRYLSYKSNYETLPLTQESKDIIKSAIEFYMKNIEQKNAAEKTKRPQLYTVSDYSR
jgi:hypothetical protein